MIFLKKNSFTGFAFGFALLKSVKSKFANFNKPDKLASNANLTFILDFTFVWDFASIFGSSPIFAFISASISENFIIENISIIINICKNSLIRPNLD